MIGRLGDGEIGRLRWAECWGQYDSAHCCALHSQVNDDFKTGSAGHQSKHRKWLAPADHMGDMILGTGKCAPAFHLQLSSL